jgi:metal-sulfur cluster biosynthetic enzyme
MDGNGGEETGGVRIASERVDMVEPSATDQQAEPQERASLREQVVEALRNVHDPELGINIVDLGLVYGVDVSDGTVHVTYTLTTMGCPIGPLIEAEIRQFLSNVEGVDEVEAEMVLRPPWTPEMMSEEAKAALGFF